VRDNRLGKRSGARNEERPHGGIEIGRQRPSVLSQLSKVDLFSHTGRVFHLPGAIAKFMSECTAEFGTRFEAKLTSDIDIFLQSVQKLFG
jgi:hypothetical protein